jgi:hypothetical protein
MRPLIEALTPPITPEPEENHKYLHSPVLWIANDACFRAKNVRIVRLFLPPHEHDSMTTRSSLSRAVKESQVVFPSTYAEEEDKLGSSSRWKRDHLRLLGVDFYGKSKLDLNRVLRVRESEWSPELRARTFSSWFVLYTRCL